jgi:hypothetical protein
MKIEELKELNRRLTALLDDPQPGLMSWCMALERVMSALVAGWTGENK